MGAGPSATKTSRERKCSADFIAERAAITQRLEEYEGELTDEERAAIIAQYDGYSERNSLMIAMQRPTATDVRGYRAWQSAGRQVRKGETGIRIYAPMATKAHDEAKKTAAENGELTTSRMRCKLVSVFDVAQTDPIEQEAQVAS